MFFAQGVNPPAVLPPHTRIDLRFERCGHLHKNRSPANYVAATNPAIVADPRRRRVQ